MLKHDIDVDYEKFTLKNLNQEMTDMSIDDNKITPENTGRQRTTLITDDLYYKCEMSSLHTKKFNKIIDKGKFKFLDSFRVAKNKNAIYTSGASDGGKGGEFFLITFDNKYIIKTINKAEEVIFRKMIKKYSEYTCREDGSFIAKIIGLFRFNFTFNSKTTKVVILENLFRDLPIERKYDMKGSTYSRKVIQTKNPFDSPLITKTLKDLDFLEIDKKICLNEIDAEIVKKRLKDDVEFFRTNKIIDYSILLGIVDLEKISEKNQKLLREMKRQEDFTETSRKTKDTSLV